MEFSQRWFQFRLKDLMTVVTILAIFCGLGLPWLQQSRELARDEACQNKLRQIGIALHIRADLDPAGQFCTGQSDFEKVGCPDKHGWIAEVVEVESGLRGKLSCPTNPLVGSEMLNGLYRGDLRTSILANPAAAADGFCGTPNWHKRSAGPGSDFAGTSTGTPQRASLITRAISGEGLATNFTPSWFLTRSAPRIVCNERKDSFLVYSTSQTAEATSPDMTLGGMTRRLLETGPIVTSNIPILGDGAAIGNLAFPLSYGRWLPGGRWDPLHDDTRRHFADQGSKIVADTNRGPAKWNPVTNRLDGITAGADLGTQYLSQFGRVVGEWHSKAQPYKIPPGDLYLQDTRGWQAWHRVGKTARCNLLMADGSVLSVEDQNGDGLLNPGFPVPAGMNDDDYAAIGYRDSTVELGPERVFSGLFLQNLVKGGD